jgi:hypothetical protein
MFNTKKIILIFAIVILAFVGYAMLISGKEKASPSGVTKQTVNVDPTGQNSDPEALDGPGRDFVTQLLAIQNIKFNLQFFSDPVFRGLQDWSRVILPQESGRPNPFAPLEGSTIQTNTTTGFTGNIESVNTRDSIVSDIEVVPKTPAKTPTRTNNSSR